MRIQTSVNVKYQVVIPKEARKKIKIKPGQKMDVEVTANRIILSPSKSEKQLKWPDDYIKKYGGIWKDAEDIDKYLKEEDKSWE